MAHPPRCKEFEGAAGQGASGPWGADTLSRSSKFLITGVVLVTLAATSTNTDAHVMLLIVDG